MIFSLRVLQTRPIQTLFLTCKKSSIANEKMRMVCAGWGSSTFQKHWTRFTNWYLLGQTDTVRRTSSMISRPHELNPMDFLSVSHLKQLVSAAYFPYETIHIDMPCTPVNSVYLKGSDSPLSDVKKQAVTISSISYEFLWVYDQIYIMYICSLIESYRTCVYMTFLLVLLFVKSNPLVRIYL